MAFIPNSGSIVSFQSNPSVLQTTTGLNSTNASIIATQIPGSILAVSGSFTAPQNQSVSGTVQADIRGSVATVIIGGSIATSIAPFNSSVQVLNFPTNQSVSGTVGASLIGTAPVTQSGIWSTSVMTNVITSIATAGQVMGSIATLQGTSPWNIAGSVAAFQAGVRSTSIVGAYQEDTPFSNGDIGLLTLTVRNDAVASIAGNNLDYLASAADSAGRLLIKPFTSEDGTIISYRGSVVSTSVTLIQASAVGKTNYITDFWVANTGPTTTLVTFRGGDTSIIGYTIAPAGSGSNSPGIAIPLKTTRSQDLAFQAVTATSVLYLTVKGYQAP